MTKIQRAPKKAGPRTDFAWLVNEGIQAYQLQRRLPTLEIVQDEIATAMAISVRTLQSWRADKRPQRYEDLRDFAQVCVKTVRELGAQWVIDLFQAAGMSAYADQVLKEIGVEHLNPITISMDSTAQKVLDESYIRPDPVFQRVRLNEFVGREWLTARVDAFLDDPAHKSGAFVLVGEAGVGKTTFLAHLVNQRNYLHLFGEQVPGAANLPHALRSLMAQLIIRYRIDPYAPQHELPGSWPSDSIAFERLLRVAASRLKPDERIVIVCDALDEVGTMAGGNVLGLPAILPDGVYLIVSHTPMPTRLHFQFVPHMIRLDPKSDDNLRDMQAYLSMIAARPDVAWWLQVHQCSASDFVQMFIERSEGIWRYVAYLVAEIGAGRCRPCKPFQLPGGLANFYAEYAAHWRDQGTIEWDTLYAPLFATLAAAQEPIPLDLLIQWAGVTASWSEIKQLLREARPFVLEREDPQRGTVYALYHHSLRDFATSNVDRNGLCLSTLDVLDDLREHTFKAHYRIVEYYRQRRGESWSRLNGHDYADRHLAFHIEQVKQGRLARQRRLEPDNSHGTTDR